MSGRITKPVDIIDRLLDLHAQATVERSHFYVGNLCTEAAREITLMREFMSKMQRAIEAEGYDIMVSVDGGFAELVDRKTLTATSSR